MDFITKNSILSLISEQEQEIDEFARPRMDGQKTKSGWEYRQTELVRIDAPGEGITTINPETGEPEDDVIYSVWKVVSPTGHEIVIFDNENAYDPKHKTEGYDTESGKIYKKGVWPRSSKYGTKFEKNTEPEYDPDDPNYEFPDEEELEKQQRKELLNKGQWAKNYVINPILNSFFGDPSIKKKLVICGIPTIVADKFHTEPSSLKTPRMNFIGKLPEDSMLRAKSLQFEYHGVRDEVGIQEAVSKIYQKRMMLANGEMPEEDEASDYNRRLYAHLYPRGKWEPGQRLDAEKHHERTPIYNLNKRQVQEGKVSFNVLSRIQFVGNTMLDGESYHLTIQFIVDKSMRGVTQSRGEERGNLIDPIRVEIRKEMPYEVRESGAVINERTKRFFDDLFQEGLKEMGIKILALNSDQVISELRVVGSDVDPEYDL